MAENNEQNTLKNLVKQCLSIISTATQKDNEIEMWIDAAKKDMERQNIDVESHIDDGLIQGTIVMYVKSNFGFVDVKEKELAQRTYKDLCTNLSLSNSYLMGVDADA